MDTVSEHTPDSTMADAAGDSPNRGSTNLPASVASLVGRDDDVAALTAQLGDGRLLTITGSGGCGKTRLAYEAARAELDRSPDGVWCVELAPIGDPDRVAAELAQVLGLREEMGRPLPDTLADQLGDFDGVIVFDNCEHVLSQTRPIVEQLLRRCPRLRVLTTSREPLGIDGETTWRVPSLSRAASVELFVQRSQNVRPGYDPSDADLHALGEIVDRLDGIPLAIELAAARMRMMSPDDINVGLDNRFRLLTGGSRTSLARQQTLEASVAWSYDLLDDDEQMVACCLSVMSDFTLEAAAAATGGDPVDAGATLDVIAHLVDKSVVRVDHSGPETRYRFLESVRQYLHGRLVESGDADAARGRHLSYFLGVVEKVEPEIAFRDSAQILAMVEREHDNLEAALDFADASGRRDEALRLATAMTLFWELRGHVGLATRWFARLLEQPDEVPTKWRGRACWGAAHIGLYGGDVETMMIRAPEALEQAEQFDDDWARARALNTIGFATAVMDPTRARAGLEQSIELGRGIGDEWAVLNSRKMLTAAGWAAQDEEVALVDLESLREHADRLEAGYFSAWYHGLLGVFLMRRGELGRARRELESAIELCDRLGEPVTGAMSKAWLWSLDVMEGEYEDAGRRSAALLRRASASGGGLAIADLLANLGQVAIARGDAAAAVDLLAPAYADQRETGIPFMVSMIGMTLASARRRVGDLDGATELLDDLDGLATTLDNRWVAAHVELERSRVSCELGDVTAAERRAHDALAAFVEMGRAPDIVASLEQLGCVAASVESDADALRCFAAAKAHRSTSGLVSMPPDAEAISALCDAARARIGDEIADEHWSEGEALTLAEAVEYITRTRGARKRPSSGWASLTPTERRVVELVAEGLTNPQIAERMFVARGTVKVHVSHIFAKLGVSGRSELAALAIRRSATGEG
jgi:predicted ATPase/DNA-binding CsgD family transcriptional regulator